MRVPPHAHRLARYSILAAVLLVLAAPASALAAPDSATVLSWLSGQRERNGIPGALAERADWSAACAAHLSYIALNGGVLTHQEVSGAPGYSAAGAWAGLNSVLSTGTWATADHDPFENAPIHLAQMLAPTLAESGASNASGLCITTWPGDDRPAPATTTIYTYPGPGTTIYASQNVSELPLTPQSALGLSEKGNGPTIYAFGVAPNGGYSGQPKLVSASLTGPSGTVPVVAADWTNATFGSALAPGTALIIPTTPLQNGATYTAQVTMHAAADAQDTTRTWSFAAGATSQALPATGLPAGAAPSPAPAAGAGAPPAGAGPSPAGAAITTRLSGSVRRLGPRRVRIRLRLPRASIGRRMRIGAVGAHGRITRVGARQVRVSRPILHLHIPHDTTALLVTVPSGGASASLRLRLRVPRS